MLRLLLLFPFFPQKLYCSFVFSRRGCSDGAQAAWRAQRTLKKKKSGWQKSEFLEFLSNVNNNYSEKWLIGHHSVSLATKEDVKYFYLHFQAIFIQYSSQVSCSIIYSCQHHFLEKMECQGLGSLLFSVKICLPALFYSWVYFFLS